jgi:hypothetical protein
MVLLVPNSELSQELLTRIAGKWLFSPSSRCVLLKYAQVTAREEVDNIGCGEHG